MFDLRIAAAALFALTVGVSGSGAAFAQDAARPAQSQMVSVGDIAGDVYYIARPDGYHVVATLAAHGSGVAPVRFQAVLVPGQAVTVSTPRGLGEPADAVEITRQNDRLLVHKVALVD